MLDDIRSAYRNYNAVLEALTGKATQSFTAGGLRLWTIYFPRRHLALLSLVRAIARSRRATVAPLSLVRAIARSRWMPWVGLVVLAISAAAYEMQTSHFEAQYFVDLAQQMTAPLKPGASTSILFPDGGPYDQRMGYAALPRFISRLTANGYVVRDQARWSPALAHFVKSGAFPVYQEKDQGGLDILDRNRRGLYGARFPQTVYRDFASVPPPIVKSLLFTEDRYLLDRGQPQRNAAIEWRRFAWAAFGRMARVAVPHLKVGGGSTLATQIEKFRHSPRGITDTVSEKWRQVLTASTRIYLDGPDTMARREQVVRTYLNSTPLASRPGYGEIIGLPDALWVWFGIANNEATRVLNEEPRGTTAWARKAEIYRDALSLILAARRPDYYLIAHRDRLDALTDRYLRILGKAGVIEPRLRDTALGTKLHFSIRPPPNPASSFVTQRAVDSVRNNLVSVLKLPSLYGLDRLDLKVQTTTDAATQARVSAFLERLSDPQVLKAEGMIGRQLLGDADPAKVTYSFVLYERAGDHNELRVRADSLNQPFDINSGALLMMGSTAKLRTLATYLEIVRNLHQQLSQRTRPQLWQAAGTAQDPLTFWAATYLVRAPDRGLQPMLDAAMARHYSGAPGAFFTGSGRQGFGNFEKSENRSNPTVASAFQHSINLSFVRLLRDIVTYYEVQSVPTRWRLLTDREDPDRIAYLRYFADQEGQSFLRRFYKQFDGRSPNQMMAAMAARTRPQAGPLASLYLAVHPNASYAELRNFLAAHLPRARVTDKEVGRVFRTDSPARLSWQDLGYVSGVHPLELWLARYRNAHPSASWKEVASASSDVRQQVYSWLFKGSMRKQDNRIRILLERAAFDRILDHWRSLGYPFEHLVPSLGTAVGASGDVPDALASLMGIILNGGVELPTESITQLRFAANTPYDTTLSRKAAVPVRVMAPEIARTLRGVLMGVVTDGTASRLRGTYARPDGSPLPIGGKTGTGDNRIGRFTAGGGMIESRVLDRTATFVFFFGDRFFGTVTAYVPAPEAGRYHFSSALAVQLLKALQPELQPLLGTAKGGGAAPAIAAPASEDLSPSAD
jgi:membrane peptidoglycan carboxypeptidase